MTSARYGRMNVGRCAQTDYGFVGCSADVLNIADRWCSGRPECTVAVSNSALVQTGTCPDDVTSYLEAGFECIEGTIRTYHYATIAITHVPRVTQKGSNRIHEYHANIKWWYSHTYNHMHKTVVTTCICASRLQPR